MPAIDLADDTFVIAAPDQVAALVADPQRWRAWWPDLQLTTTRDRGVKGRQWRVQGALVGTAELWLEPWRDGVIVHCYLRCEPTQAAVDVDRERRRRAQSWKRAVHALKDALEVEPDVEPDVKPDVLAADVLTSEVRAGEVQRERPEVTEETVTR